MNKIVDHCWLLDLDRTLSEVEIVMDAVEHICNKMGLDYEKIAEQKFVAESHGHSFSAITTIRSLWPERVREFFDGFKKIKHINSIYPDGREFIDRLKSLSSPFVVITYGDPMWQEAKLHLLGLWKEPFILCDIPEKSLLLRQYLKGGVFYLPTSSSIIQTKRVTLVDDKLEAFINMPLGSKGIFINRSGKISAVESGIREIKSFQEIINEIKN